MEYSQQRPVLSAITSMSQVIDSQEKYSSMNEQNRRLSIQSVSPEFNQNVGRLNISNRSKTKNSITLQVTCYDDSPVKKTMPTAFNSPKNQLEAENETIK